MLQSPDCSPRQYLRVVRHLRPVGPGPLHLRGGDARHHPALEEGALPGRRLGPLLGEHLQPGRLPTVDLEDAGGPAWKKGSILIIEDLLVFFPDLRNDTGWSYFNVPGNIFLFFALNVG